MSSKKYDANIGTTRHASASQGASLGKRSDLTAIIYKLFYAKIVILNK